MADPKLPPHKMVPTASLLPYARNARTHDDAQVAALAASITSFGFVNPVLIDAAGEIIAGHGRVLAAQSLGLEKVPAIRLAHLTEAQARALRLADNRIAEQSGWDEELLTLELGALAEIGFDMAPLGFEIGAYGGPDVRDDEDEDAPEAPTVAVTRPGDLWHLGDHRLLCGDSTDAAAVSRLMGADRAALLFTSPPYGNQRDYTTGGIGDWDALMRGVCGHLDAAVAPDAQVLVNLGLIHRDAEWQPYWSGWLDWMRTIGWYVWDQGPGLPGDWNGRLAPSFEFIFHFNRTARQANKIIPCRWAGHVNSEKGDLRAKDGTVGEWTHAGQGVQETRIPDNVLRITRHKARGIETEHPAVFPVKLPEFLMRTFSDEGALVFEPFTGSGTTILAGQRTDRTVRAIEVAPAYVDLAIARFRALHPDLPVTLDGEGRDYDAVAAARGVTEIAHAA